MPFTEGLAFALQTTLNEAVGNNSPELKRDETGYLSALQSQENLNGVDKIPISKTGRRRQVRLTYVERGTEAETRTTEPADCTAPVERSPQEVYLDVDAYLGTTGITLDSKEIRKLIEGPEAWKIRVLNSQLNAMSVKLNKLLLAQQAAAFGKFLDATQTLPKDVELITNANKPEYYGESIMMEDYHDIGGVGRPLVIGAGKLSHYARMTDIGCCNAGGINLSQAGNFDFYRDRFAGSIFGNPDEFILMSPGSVQLVTFNENEGEYAMSGDTFMHGSLVDPYTGIKYDLNMVYDACPGEKKWKIWLSLYYKLFFVPSDAFNTNDDLYQVNGTLHYKATKGL